MRRKFVGLLALLGCVAGLSGCVAVDDGYSPRSYHQTDYHADHHALASRHSSSHHSSSSSRHHHH